MADLKPIPPIAGFSIMEGRRAAKTDLYQYGLKLGRENTPISSYDATNLIVTTAALTAEVCDESRFEKAGAAAFGSAGDSAKGNQTATLRGFLGTGLISAYNDEPAWGRGHRILSNAFSPTSLNELYGASIDGCAQLAMRLESTDKGKDIEVAKMAGTLFFEIMSQYALSQNLGAFYSDNSPIFVTTATRVVHQLVLRRLLPSEVMKFDVHANRQINKDIAAMHDFADQLIAARRALGAGNEGTDLLGHMLQTPDPQTGEFMSDLEIRYELLTLLGAGQEGPHNILTTALHVVASNPDLFARIRTQIDEVLGADSNRLPTVEEVAKLTLIDGLVKETMRVYPSALAFTRSARETTVIGGQYEVTPDMTVVVFLPSVHRDPTVWDRPDEFDVDRWSPEMEASLPPGAYKPFSTGARACIGRLLALTELQTALATLIQHFDLSAPSEPLEFGVSLTLKPKPYTLRFTPRPDRAPMDATFRPEAVRSPEPAAGDVSSAESDTSAEWDTSADVAATSPGDSADQSGTQTLVVWHASDGGTALALARRIASGARNHGFEARLGVLNDAVANLDKDHLNVIIAASYNGQPATSGSEFVTWLKSVPNGSLGGTDFAVFGCGDRHWTDTYQAVPTLLDTQLAAAGANRVVDRGSADSSGDFDSAFNDWTAGLWALIAPNGGEHTDPGATLVAGPNPDQLAYDLDLSLATLVSSAELQRHWGSDHSEFSTMHLEVDLPADVEYQAGDHMLVLPANREGSVRAAAKLFGIEPGALLRLHYPADQDKREPELVSATELLRTRLQLNEPAQRAGVELLAQYVDSEGHRDELMALIKDDDSYRAQILDKHVSLIDLAAQFPPSELLPVAHLERAFSAIKPRTYSISSAPTSGSQRASLTVGVLERPALAGSGTFHGICSTYLAELPSDAQFYMKVKRPGPGFALPEEDTKPVIMICAGTGIAPFRGFLQQLGAAHDSGASTPPVVLFRGCRRSDHDTIYGDEIDQWVEQGWLQYFPAFSHEPGQDPQHVEDVMVEQADVLNPLLDADAKFLICGDADQFYRDIEQTMVKLRTTDSTATDSAADDWLQQLKANGRYVVDIWAQQNDPAPAG
ncbi:MAG: cytochrome P450 [Candidatus Nanopelagicales bacterium]